jgi:hypothetical protein
VIKDVFNRLAEVRKSENAKGLFIFFMCSLHYRNSTPDYLSKENVHFTARPPVEQRPMYW